MQSLGRKSILKNNKPSCDSSPDLIPHHDHGNPSCDSDISIQNVKHSCSLDLKVLGNDLFLPKVECESGMKMTLSS